MPRGSDHKLSLVFSSSLSEASVKELQTKVASTALNAVPRLNGSTAVKAVPRLSESLDGTVDEVTEESDAETVANSARSMESEQSHAGASESYPLRNRKRQAVAELLHKVVWRATEL